MEHLGMVYESGYIDLALVALNMDTLQGFNPDEVNGGCALQATSSLEDLCIIDTSHNYG